MKPIWGINLTENKKNEEMNGQEFLAATPSAALAQALNRSEEKADATTEKAKLPLAFRLMQNICGFLGAICVVGLLRGMREVTMTQAYENAPWIFWIGGACLAVYGILKLIGMQKEKTVMSTEESAQTFSNLEGKYAFPRSACVAIHTVKKHIRVASWNKSINLNKGIYKPYKLTTDNYGAVHCQYYHILEIRQNGEAWGLYFPCYELPTFEALTGLKAQPINQR